MILVFLYVMLACPIAALICNVILPHKQVIGAKLSGYLIGCGFLAGLGELFLILNESNAFKYALMDVNPLNLVLSCLVLLVSFVVHRFALRYMYGDRLYKRFFLLLATITFSAVLMVLANNIFLFWGSWVLSNMCLVLLMVHKKEWAASKNAGILGFATLMLGACALLIALLILFNNYSLTVISNLDTVFNQMHGLAYYVCVSCILIAALAQSGIFPLHRWLLSSLNSPTPVSALMHAGLVNGGGILIVKFAPIMTNQALFLLFVAGAVSALLGSIWKLMQHDVKKMLACSTMAQMGFMMMQCGLGLFAAAITHLCWHGLFKAYLFLSSGSAIAQNKLKQNATSISPLWFCIALGGGIIATTVFTIITGKFISASSANIFVLFFAFIAGSQVMLTWLRSTQNIIGIAAGIISSLLAGLFYGLSIKLIESILPTMLINQEVQLNLMHLLVLLVFAGFWLAFSFDFHNKFGQSKLGCWLYMQLFNSSQPGFKTVTSLRHDYKY